MEDQDDDLTAPKAIIIGLSLSAGLWWLIIAVVRAL